MREINEKMICSRCGKEIKDIYTKISTGFEVVSLTEEGCSVRYSNISEPTSEILCSDCFNEYCECIDSLNKKNNGLLIVDMVEVIDDVQYGCGRPDLNVEFNHCTDCNEEPNDIKKINLAEMVEYIDE